MPNVPEGDSVLGLPIEAALEGTSETKALGVPDAPPLFKESLPLPDHTML